MSTRPRSGFVVSTCAVHCAITGPCHPDSPLSAQTMLHVANSRLEHSYLGVSATQGQWRRKRQSPVADRYTE